MNKIDLEKLTPSERRALEAEARRWAEQQATPDQAEPTASPERLPRGLRPLKPQHARVVALHLRGLTCEEIAVQVGLRPMQIYSILWTPRARAHIAAALEMADAELKALTPQAVSALRRGLDSDDLRLALKASDQFWRTQQKYREQPEPPQSAEDVMPRVLEMARRAGVPLRARLRSTRGSIRPGIDGRLHLQAVEAEFQVGAAAPADAPTAPTADARED